MFWISFAVCQTEIMQNSAFGRQIIQVPPKKICYLKFHFLEKLFEEFNVEIYLFYKYIVSLNLSFDHTDLNILKLDY